MAFDYRLFAVPFIISGIISLVVALLVLQRLHVKGGLALALLMLQFAVWAGANAVRWSLVDPAAQVFWLMLAHAMLIPAPATFLIFVAQLTDTDRWLTRTSLLFLASEPVATMLIIAPGTPCPVLSAVTNTKFPFAIGDALPMVSYLLPATSSAFIGAPLVVVIMVVVSLCTAPPSESIRRFLAHDVHDCTEE